jgi:hypothetical protein
MAAIRSVYLHSPAWSRGPPQMGSLFTDSWIMSGQIDFEAGDGFRVTLVPRDGGKTVKLIMQGWVPDVGTEVNLKGKPYRIKAVKPERIIAVIERPGK